MTVILAAKRQAKIEKLARELAPSLFDALDDGPPNQGWDDDPFGNLRYYLAYNNLPRVWAKATRMVDAEDRLYSFC